MTISDVRISIPNQALVQRSSINDEEEQKTSCTKNKIFKVAATSFFALSSLLSACGAAYYWSENEKITGIMLAASFGVEIFALGIVINCVSLKALEQISHRIGQTVQQADHVNEGLGEETEQLKQSLENIQSLKEKEVLNNASLREQIESITQERDDIKLLFVDIKNLNEQLTNKILQIKEFTEKIVSAVHGMSADNEELTQLVTDVKYQLSLIDQLGVKISDQLSKESTTLDEEEEALKRTGFQLTRFIVHISETIETKRKVILDFDAKVEQFNLVDKELKNHTKELEMARREFMEIKDCIVKEEKELAALNNEASSIILQLQQLSESTV